MNVFATLKTVFFGSKFLSSPVSTEGTLRRDLVSALNGVMPLCRTIPGVRLALDIREIHTLPDNKIWKRKCHSFHFYGILFL